MDRVAFLEALLAIPSPSGKEDAVAAYLVEQMETLGAEARCDEVGNAVGIWGSPQAERTVVLLGHLDTVPGEIPVRQEGGRLYGRGAVDAKGPLAAFVLAAAQVTPELNGMRLAVIGAVEEESSARGARYLARTLLPPYCAIVGEPSDWQGITLGYKGSLSLDYRLEQPAGHSAGKHPRPAEEAVGFWNRVVEFCERRNEGRSGRFRTLDPSLRSFCTSSNGLTDEVELRIGLRLPPGESPQGLEQTLESWAGDAQLTFHPSDPAFCSEKNTPPVRALLRAIRGEGGRPRFKLKTGTADMNVVGPAWGCPIVAYGPGDSSLDHTPDEHIEIDEFLRAVDVLASALQVLAAS
jgi:LysW-gamma-L-lysine carboxypeptidase